MRHKKKKNTLGRTSGKRRALLRTLAISLIEHGQITTTPAKAKAVQQFVEPLITRGKTPGMNSIRLIESKLASKQAAMEVVNKLSPRFKERPGGYTSLQKVADRKGDGAKQVQLSFVSD